MSRATRRTTIALILAQLVAFLVAVTVENNKSTPADVADAGEESHVSAPDVPDVTNTPSGPDQVAGPLRPSGWYLLTAEQAAARQHWPVHGPFTAEPEPAPSVYDADGQVDRDKVIALLRELGYWLPGTVDDTTYRSAVHAFQKVNLLTVDGVVGPVTARRLDTPTTPTLQGGDPTRIEVDLTLQVAHLVLDGQRAATFAVSSGNGKRYSSPNTSSGFALARTPVGDFTILRRVEGVRKSGLGILYDPLYFRGPYAIHGSNSVPAWPASHGCIRVTRPAATWLARQVANGTQVKVYGGTHVWHTD